MLELGGGDASFLLVLPSMRTLIEDKSEVAASARHSINDNKLLASRFFMVNCLHSVSIGNG